MTRSDWDSISRVPRPCFKLELDYPQPLAGVDEAGCAPLAGPVVAAAVILDRKHFPRGIDDSKNLPLEKREALYAKLVKCAAWGVGVASVEEIDALNIYWARMLAMERAVEKSIDGLASPAIRQPWLRSTMIAIVSPTASRVARTAARPSSSRRGSWSTAMPARAGSGRRRRSSLATRAADRSPPRRSSPR